MTDDERDVENARLRYESEYDFMDDVLPSGESVYDHFARLGWIFDEDGELAVVPSGPSAAHIRAIVRGDYKVLDVV